MQCLLNPNLQEPPALLLQPVCPGVFYRAFELCYPHAKDLIRVHFPSVSFLRYFLTPSAHCACPTTCARSFFHGPLTLPTLELAPSFSSPPFKSVLNVLFPRSLQAVCAEEKGFVMPRAHQSPRSGRHPASSNGSAEHPPTIAVRVPLDFALCRRCSPCREIPPWFLVVTSFLEPILSLQAAWKPPSCQQQQIHSALLEQHSGKRHLGMLSQGSKKSYFCEAGLGEQACPYDHVWLPSVARFHQAG